MRQTLHNTRPVKAKVHIIGGYGVPAVACASCGVNDNNKNVSFFTVCFGRFLLFV